MAMCPEAVGSSVECLSALLLGILHSLLLSMTEGGQTDCRGLGPASICERQAMFSLHNLPRDHPSVYSYKYR